MRGEKLGLFDSIFKGLKPKAQTSSALWETLTAYKPAFTNWRGELYESELIRAVIDAEARHASKLEIVFEGQAREQLRNNMRIAPNPWQTWSQFLYRLSVILNVCNNAFIVPLLDKYGDVEGYFPVVPTSCEIVSYEGKPYLRYYFANGKVAAIEKERCGILTRHQFKDDVFGENNHALDSTLSLIDKQKQAIEEGIKNGATYRFMAKLGNFAKPSDIAKERKQFDAENFSGEAGGLLLFPSTYTDIKQVEAKQFLVDDKQMSIIQTNVFNYFGSNLGIIQSTAIGNDLDAYWNSKLEPFAIQLSEVLTIMTYTRNEQMRGNRAFATANRLQYMDINSKINMAKELGDRGALTIDEIRALLNYAPLPDGAGAHAPIRGEYYMVDEGRGNDNTEV